MQASNVAIVFGPTLMRAEMDSMEMAILMPVQNGIVEVMINDYESVFQKWGHNSVCLHLCLLTCLSCLLHILSAS